MNEVTSISHKITVLNRFTLYIGLKGLHLYPRIWDLELRAVRIRNEINSLFRSHSIYKEHDHKW